MVPVVKKNEGERMEEYRGVTLTQTAYKVYAEETEGRNRKKGIAATESSGLQG